MSIKFSKWTGLGNDFVLLEPGESLDFGDGFEQQIIKLCDRRFGIGADGVVVAKVPDVTLHRAPVGDGQTVEREVGHIVPDIEVISELAPSYKILHEPRITPKRTRRQWSVSAALDST